MEKLSSSRGDILGRESATLHWGSSCTSIYIAAPRPRGRLSAEIWQTTRRSQQANRVEQRRGNSVMWTYVFHIFRVNAKLEAKASRLPWFALCSVKPISLSAANPAAVSSAFMLSCSKQLQLAVVSLITIYQVELF